MIYANLLHLSYNMWCDWQNPAVKSPYYAAKPYLRFDDALWNDLLAAMVKAKMNMVVIDLGDGVKYESHPEIAGLRRLHLPRVRYFVYFRPIGADLIEIVAFWHTSRGTPPEL